MHQAQGRAHQGVEGPLEGLVAHPGAAKGDAPDVSLWVLQRSPCGACSHHHTASAITISHDNLVGSGCSAKTVCNARSLHQHNHALPANASKAWISTLQTHVQRNTRDKP